ncbi:hypothetical protein BYT27DRAFT_7246960 [Phlegmacium glaucopus]|nr:hypothetical protein BYT27DRAFT_7246960 [Phlegmacium glaucopus]
MKLILDDFNITGACLEGFLYELYSGIFAIYLQDQCASKKGTNKKKYSFLCSIPIPSYPTTPFCCCSRHSNWLLRFHRSIHPIICVAGANLQYILSGRFKVVEPDCGHWINLAGVVMSMTVDALVTGLIISKIFNIVDYVLLLANKSGTKNKKRSFNELP